MSALNTKALISLAILALVMATVIFVAAGTLDYWQGWTFLLVYFAASLAVTVDLMRRDPALLARRMRGGPFAETESAQRIIMMALSVGFIALIVVPALDHRFGWSAMPSAIVILGDVLVAAGFAAIVRVFRENSFTASTVQVAAGQQVISSGPYAIVRHPMYAAALVLLAGIPLALGSWWGLLVVIALVPMLIWRLLDEERLLAANLPGYRDYQGRVRYRLLPSLW
jgi:protein-S-isoprenylcysteine O-methyltransferase Ste14